MSDTPPPADSQPDQMDSMTEEQPSPQVEADSLPEEETSPQAEAGNLPEEETPEEPPRTITSAELLCGQKELLIEHEGEVYRLRVTRNSRLILQK